MRRVPFILLFLCAAVIGLSTWVEDAHGTEYAHGHIYGAWWFALLWAAVIAATVAVIVRRSMWKRIPAFVLHVGFVVVFAGALTTATTGHKGIIHLRKGQPTAEYIDEQRKVLHIPFLLRLDSFRVVCYPGTETPSDYVSRVTCMQADGTASVQGTVSMNRIFSAQGFRFYQSSFDEDKEGSWLSVNYDPYGTSVTYAGFFLVAIGLLLILLDPRGGFRRLWQHPLLRKGGVLLVCLSAIPQASDALPVIRKAQADSLTALPVVYNGRIAPFNTLAKDFLQKVYGRGDFRGLTPEQVVCSWTLTPDEWNRTPIIRIKSRELRAALGLDKEHASLADLFDDGASYKLQPLWQREMGSRSKLARAIQETDEKVGLILMLRQGTLVQPASPDAPVSQSKIKAELLYNRIPFSKILAMANLALGFTAFALLLFRLLTGRTEGRTGGIIWSTLLCLSTLFHLMGYCLRGYVCGGIPLSNGYETMQFAALAILITSCLLQWRFPFMRTFGFLLSGFTLLVAFLGGMNPQITPLMPVLASPWLSFHVSFIMISYALYAFVCLNAILVLGLMGATPAAKLSPRRREQAEQLTLLSRLLTYPATLLLGIGVIFGAVWANVSWGSYWSWDPKEVWALVAFLVYGISFHGSSLRILKNVRAYHIYVIFAFGVVLMTYFGVNYLLGGMHSYANG